MQKEIFTNAHPRSGVTWLNYILCTLLNCPLQNNRTLPYTWTTDTRDDSHVVRKLHLAWPGVTEPELFTNKIYPEEFFNSIDPSRLIFLHRDPRSVFISMCNYDFGQDITVENLKPILDARLQKHSGKSIYELYVRTTLDNPNNYAYATTYRKMQTQIVIELKNIARALDLDISDEKISDVTSAGYFREIKRQEPRHYWNNAYDKFFPIPIDTWKMFITQELGERIHEAMFDFLVEFGFEEDKNWYKYLKKE